MDELGMLRHLEQVVNKHAIVSRSDLEGNITYANEQFCSISGYSREELIGKNHRILNSGFHAEAFFAEMWRTLVSGRTWHGQIKNRRKDGSCYWVETTISPIHGADGERVGYISIRTDITRIHDLMEQVHLQANVLGMTTDAILIADAQAHDFPLIYVNPAFTRITGYSPAEVMGRNCRFLNNGDIDQPGISVIREALEKARNAKAVLRNYRKDGSLFWNEIHISPVFGDKSEVTHFVAIEQDVTERVNAEQALLAARDEAERANQAKSEFLTRMSHELRTPLNSILGFAQLLESDPVHLLSEPQKEGIGQILKAGWHLLGLIDQLLDLGKIESGKISLSIEEIPLNDVVLESLGLTEGVRRDHGASFSMHVADDMTVIADRMRLRQILVNLFSNAAKYGNGEVLVAAERNGAGMIRITVSDKGAGIDQQQIARLFEPFDRLDADKRGIQGTGVGLAISKQLVELMKGGIGVESSPGEGSRFWIELPSRTMPVANKDADAKHRPERHVLLYVEDNPESQILVEQILSRLPNVELHGAHTADMGISLARAIRPDLILSDLHLPGMDGYTMLSILRKDEATRHIPVIALSAHARQARKMEAAGFTHFIEKPINVQEFMKVVSSVLSGKAPE